ncbi:MAG: hypothetical protein AAFX06_32570 [Planctomycetota bacterium]
MQIVIKADDFGRHDHLDCWKRFVDIAHGLGVPVAIGVVGSHLTSIERERLDWIAQIPPDLVEWWNHGFSHEGHSDSLTTEFVQKAMAEQADSIRRTQSLMKDKLKIDATTFGAPFNRNDKNTESALRSVRDLKYWFFPLNAPQSESLIAIGARPRFRIENSRHQLCENDLCNVSQELSELNAGISPLQLHPGKWTKSSLLQLRELIARVTDCGAEFVLPRDYKGDS